MQLNQIHQCRSQQNISPFLTSFVFRFEEWFKSAVYPKNFFSFSRRFSQRCFGEFFLAVPLVGFYAGATYREWSQKYIYPRGQRAREKERELTTSLHSPTTSTLHTIANSSWRESHSIPIIRSTKSVGNFRHRLQPCAGHRNLQESVVVDTQKTRST